MKYLKQDGAIEEISLVNLMPEQDDRYHNPAPFDGISKEYAQVRGSLHTYQERLVEKIRKTTETYTELQDFVISGHFINVFEHANNDLPDMLKTVLIMRGKQKIKKENKRIIARLVTLAVMFTSHNPRSSFFALYEEAEELLDNLEERIKIYQEYYDFYRQKQKV